MLDIIFFLNNYERCNSIIYIVTAFIIGTVQLTMTYTDLSVMGCEVSQFGTICQNTMRLFPNIITFTVTTMTTQSII